MKLVRLPLAAAILVSSIGVAGAEQRYPEHAKDYYSLYKSGAAEQSLGGFEQRRVDNSGSVERLGLGANPHYPEGPGNPNQ